MFFILLGIVIEGKEVHPIKVSSRISSIFSGISIDTNEEQPEKALQPISVIF